MDILDELAASLKDAGIESGVGFDRILFLMHGPHKVAEYRKEADGVEYAYGGWQDGPDWLVDARTLASTEELIGHVEKIKEYLIGLSEHARLTGLRPAP